MISKIDINNYLCPSCFTNAVGECRECGQHSNYLKDGICRSCLLQNKYREIYGKPAIFSGQKLYIVGASDCLREFESVPTMSMLNGSSKEKADMLILTQYLSYRKDMDLVIAPCLDGSLVNLCEYSCTMTELKTDPYSYIRKHFLSCIDDGEYWDIELGNNEIFHLFKKPYQLNAMTYRDMNYGNGGNEYGDTSLFLIIGAIEKTR